MFTNKQILALASALLANEALALNAHRHAHQHAHNKKDVAYMETDYVTVTDWTTLTVWEGESTSAAASMYKASPNTEHYAPAAASSSSSVLPTSSPKAMAVVPSTTSVAPVVSIQAEPVVPAVASSVESKAAAPAPVATKAAAAPAGNKRGLAYNDGSLLSGFLGTGSKCNWSYNWGQTKDGRAPDSVEFVPMMWGPTHADTWPANAKKAISDGAKYFLSFNECDNKGQANMGPADAAQAHIKHMNEYSGQVQISTPAITNSGNAGEGLDWLSQFLSSCNGQCAYDFCAIHWYSPANPADFLGHLLKAHDVCKKPIWITEFAPFGSDSEINNFLVDVMDQMDNNSTFSFVHRYSYFMVGPGSMVTSGASLSSYGNTFAYHS